jgi:hypothetical protein
VVLLSRGSRSTTTDANDGWQIDGVAAVGFIPVTDEVRISGRDQTGINLAMVGGGRCCSGRSATSAEA